MQKFKIGDNVKHLTGSQIMIVVKYKTESKIEISGPKSPFNTQKITTKELQTNIVICSWVDKDNHEQQNGFNEETLILLK